MILITLLTFLALMASGVASMPAPELIPVRAPNVDKAGLVNIAPSNILSMHYGLNNSQLANVTLHLDHPGIMLEEIDKVSKVECGNDSIAITFTSPQAFEMTKEEWPGKGELVFITNHQGDCDLENERGIFLANDIEWKNSTMQVMANAERKDVHSAASALEVDFSHLAAKHPNKRDITFQKDGLNMAGDVSLPHDMKIFSVDPVFTATATKADLSDNITFSGYMKYHIHNNYLESMYFDFDAALMADLGFNFDFTAPFSRNLTFSPDALQLSTINIPKILQLGPSLRWAIGVEVGTSMSLSVGTNVWAQIPHGQLHLDLVDNTQTHAEGWTPDHNLTLGDVSRTVTLSASPLVDFSAELAVRVLGGKLDLSAGFRAETKYVNELSFTRVMVIPIDGEEPESADGQNTTTTTTNTTTIQRRDAPEGMDCASGVEHHTAVDFSVTAFLTEKWEKELFSYETAVEDTCYSLAV
ncbi:hypothetical protein F4775DRAFT_603714 [Biscogniauxia sp. FL1348]|nr:hypothetical protein F4775DRAFT_603714 [Biscogniauxia sp. FL1348]